MIVELIGPPGAGKSSLLPVVVRALSARSGAPCEASGDAVDRVLRQAPTGRLLAPLLRRRPRRMRSLLVDLPYGVAFVAAHPLLTLAAVAAILRSPVAWDHRWTLFSRWAGVAARQQFLRARLGDGTAVFDEGLYHRSINLFAWRWLGGWRAARSRRQATSQLRDYLRRVPAPALAVFVDVSDDLAERRLGLRGLPIRLRGRSPAEVSAFLETAGRIARLIPGETANRTRWLHVENAGTLEAAADALDRQIGALCSDGPGTTRP